MAEDRWLTFDEAAVRVRRSKPTIYRWVADGDLRAFGRRVAVSDLLEVDRVMRERRRGGGRWLDVSVEGVRVGRVRYNQDTGRIAGEIVRGLVVPGVAVSSRSDS